MAEEKAKFRFERYQITKSLIEISNSSNIDKDIEVEIKKTNAEHTEENIFKLMFDVNIKDANKSLNIDINAEGFFEFDKELNDSEKSSFFNINAPAILFPYIRAYITTLTSLSGITPIILPTINLVNRK